MSKNKIQAVRGMNDILPEKSFLWRRLEQAVDSICWQSGYQRIRLPIVESTNLFKRTIGEVTDIVEKEMYTFDDRNGESLTLRPEGTAGCVRAGIQHGLLYNQIQRLWYMGAMFRHERPQKGRYRQFHQVGVEAFGLNGPAVDAELIAMNAALWQELGLIEKVELQLNSLGTASCRARYREALVAYFSEHMEQLDDESKRRLHDNPLRLLDSKNPEMADLISAAPLLPDYLSPEARQHHDDLCGLLDDLNINYTHNPHLVRGLDYYGLTVFEWVTDALGAQGTVSAGGRYDGLVEQLGGHATPAAGFALGIERVIALLELQDAEPPANADVYMVISSQAMANGALAAATQLRAACPGLRVVTDLTGGAIKKQMKRADASGAASVVIIGDDESVAQTWTIKSLRGDAQQVELPADKACEFFVNQFIEE